MSCAEIDEKVISIREDVKTRVVAIAKEHLGVEESQITEEASFVNDLGADSLDVVELVMAFEEAFDVEISDDVSETILTVGDAINYLETLLVERSKEAAE